ncbi:MAG TPA: HD domain-containing phosphohydrolase, partial [Acidimicrobiales bacterium]
LIKNHPLEGARLTAPLAGWLGPWASTIAEHHEKFDGTGYPFGLSGEEISLGGRIVAVADSYDTMTSVRSYQPQLSPEAARAELAACAGSHFDPKIVRAFLDISIGRIRPVSGPLAWIGSLPFLGNVPQLGQAAAVLGRVAAATITVGGAVTTGTLHLAPAPAGHSPNGLAGGSDSNGTGTRRTTGTQPSRPQKPSAPSGVSSVKAGSTNTTTSTTLAGGSNAPGHGPPNPGGVTGTRPPVATVPTTTVAAPSTTTTTTTTLGPTPVTGSLTIRDGNGQPGRAGQNDQIIVTLSPAPALSAFCSAWSASSYPDLARPNIQVNIDQPAPGSNDMVASIVDSSDCKTGFHFGTIDLGQAGYVNGSATFGGGNSQCTANLFSGCTSIHWDGHNTLTITLGQPSTGQPTQASLSTAVYTPDPALNLSGTIRSATEENF